MSAQGTQSGCLRIVRNALAMLCTLNDMSFFVYFLSPSGAAHGHAGSLEKPPPHSPADVQPHAAPPAVASPAVAPPAVAPPVIPREFRQLAAAHDAPISHRVTATTPRRRNE